MEVFKYRQGNKDDLDALFNNYFFAPLAKDLNDPFETFLDEESYIDELNALIKAKGKQHSENVKQHSKNVVESVNNVLGRFNKETGFYSLTKNSSNEMMWSLYANSHKGFCIEYDLKELLKQGVKSNKFRYKLEVEYSDTPPVIRLEDIAKINEDKGQTIFIKKGGTKSLSWSHEQEIRIISDKIGKNYYEPIALKAIYFGVRMESKIKQLIVENFKNSNIKFYQMELIPNSYQLSFNPI